MAQDLVANEREVNVDAETGAAAWVVVAVLGLCVAFWAVVVAGVVVLV